MRDRIVPIVLVCTLLLLSGCLSRTIYHPSHEVRYTPANEGLVYESIRIIAKDGVRISGWWIPAASPRATVLFCHGNAGNIADRLDTILILNRMGLNVLIFDYRGYGLSEGTPHEEGTYLDADAAMNYLLEQRGIEPGEIIVWGRSLGGAIAARTADEHPAGLVIIESSFTCLKDLVNDHLPWVPSWILANYAYDTRHYVESINVPVLVIHSLDDEIIPFEHGKLLYDSIKGPKAFLQIRGSHNRGFIDSLEVYEASVSDFIGKYFAKAEVFSDRGAK